MFGSKYERELKRLRPYVDQINALEPQISLLSEAQLKAKTEAFKKQVREEYQKIQPEVDSIKAEIAQSSGAERQKLRLRLRELVNTVFADILCEAFAMVREAGSRTLNMRHFDVQLMGGIMLHEGKISEMKTGEGKTLVATLPVYLNALLGRGVHVITVNDYLARRDSEWMGKIYTYLGLTVGIIQHEMNDQQRQQAYEADTTYGTNNEFGFDYLRDNMKFRLEDYVQRGHNFAIVDEVDSILIDEARTPLIISGEVEQAGDEAFDAYNPYIRELVRHKQQSLIQELLQQANKLSTDTQLDEKAEVLLLCKYADPKNAGFLQVMEDKRLAKALEEVEGNHRREKTLSGLLDEKIYYALNEEGKSAELNKIGRDYLAQRNPKLFGNVSFKNQDAAFHDKIYEIQRNPDLAPQDKEKMLAQLQWQMETGLAIEHNINQLLKAHTVFENEVDYVVKDGQVIIVDEFTGRMMPGRRWSDGLHQAVEAKEGVKVAKANQTLATITLQNYFRMYDKLAGMTGTADTEALEFNNIYGLDVAVIPTNKPMVRTNYPDVIYRTEREKFKAVCNEIVEVHKTGQPMLVGTISIEKSERLSALLKQRGVRHEVLNAKYHEKEAHIVAQAGRLAAVTIATNMAGRGTDIVLGGAEAELNTPEHDAWLAEHKKVVELGGLHIIGTERHESRRIDNQLRGRSGRQGDPGSSRFYISLEDDLMRLFGSERISNIMLRLGMEEDQPIEHNLVSRALENAQKRVEGNNYEIRKRLLEYDDVMNKQREVIYAQRRQVLEGESLKSWVLEMMGEVVDKIIDNHIDPEQHPDEWDCHALGDALLRQFGMVFPVEQWHNELNYQQLRDKIQETVQAVHTYKEQQLTEPMMRHIERIIMLQTIDTNWKEHLHAIDQLKEGINLRGYGHKDPLVEYQREGFEMFAQMIEMIKQEVAHHLLRVRAVEEEEQVEEQRQHHVEEQIKEPSHVPQKHTGTKVGRNDPCPCGSGKKFKKCHGAK
ncbi:MAG: preprotein translocase subunit SecA [Candidatus Schekmanbacteria bacterium]|nr:preprotein translocase subunit SecA [Candidatus Schekmanbacteria bacterium]